MNKRSRKEAETTNKQIKRLCSIEKEKKEKNNDDEEEEEEDYLTYKTPTIHKNSITEDWFKVLGISCPCRTADVRKAYLSLSRLYHPDKNPDATKQELCIAQSRLTDVQTAYKVLGDRASQRKYIDMVSKELDMRKLIEDPRGIESGRKFLDEPIDDEPDQSIVYFMTKSPPMKVYIVSLDQLKKRRIEDCIQVPFKRICRVCDGIGCDKSKILKTKTCTACEGTGKIPKKYVGIGKDVQDQIVFLRCRGCMSIGKIRDVDPCEGCNGSRFETPIAKDIRFSIKLDKMRPGVTKVIPEDKEFSPIYIRFKYPIRKK